MTDYDPKPTAYHEQEIAVEHKSGMGWLGWLIGLLILGAIIWFLFFFFDVDKTEDGNLEMPTVDVDVDGGDVDLPEFDVDAGEIDVDLPTVDLDVDGGDIDVRGAAEGAEADDIADVDGTVDPDSEPGLDDDLDNDGDDEL